VYCNGRPLSEYAVFAHDKSTPLTISDTGVGFNLHAGVHFDENRNHRPDTAKFEGPATHIAKISYRSTHASVLFPELSGSITRRWRFFQHFSGDGAGMSQSPGRPSECSCRGIIASTVELHVGAGAQGIFQDLHGRVAKTRCALRSG